MNYLKLDGKSFSLEEMEKLALTGNIEAAKKLGRYYGRKAKNNPEYYEKCISFFLICTNAGCKDYMINVSQNALKYGKHLLTNQKDGNYKMYFCIAYDYAFKAFSKNSKRAFGCLIRSIMAIKEYDIKINMMY